MHLYLIKTMIECWESKNPFNGFDSNVRTRGLAWVRLLRKSNIWFSPLVNSLLPNIFILAKRVTLGLLVSFRRLELWSLEKVQLSQAPCGMCNKDHNNFHCLIQKFLPSSFPNIFSIYIYSHIGSRVAFLLYAVHQSIFLMVPVVDFFPSSTSNV